MTRDEAAVLLRQFCDLGSEKLTKPFQFEGWHVGTDGKIVGCIPGQPDGSTPPISLASIWIDMHRTVNEGGLVPLPEALPTMGFEMKPCTECHGKGATPARLDCETCDGTGDCLHCGHECDKCDGAGWVEADYPGGPCARCKGAGTIAHGPNACVVAGGVVGLGYAMQLLALTASVRWCGTRFLAWTAGPMTGLLMPLGDQAGDLKANCIKRGAVLL